MKLPTQPPKYNASFEQQRSGIIERAMTSPQSNLMRVIDGVPEPGATSGLAQIYVDSADGSLKVVFSNGTVKVLATNP